MPTSKGIQRTESIYEKIQRTKSFGSEKPQRFGRPNLFANRFNVLYSIARCLPVNFKYKMVNSGNILEALWGGLALGWIDTVDIFHILP